MTAGRRGTGTGNGPSASATTPLVEQTHQTKVGHIWVINRGRKSAGAT
jgi:hypothetical protein